MILDQETDIATQDLPLEAFRAHLCLGTGFADDALQTPVLESFLRAAIAAIERATGKALLTRRFRYRVPGWRAPDAQPLPVAPVTALVGLDWIAHDGTVTAVDLARVWLQPDAQTPVLRPSGACLPAIPTRAMAQITFDAGYGASWAAVPADLAQAVMLLAAHYYEYRNETRLGAGCMPFGVTSLITRYRPMRLDVTGGMAS